MAGVRAHDAVDGCMRHAARVDATQEQIVSALRAAGARVWIIGLPVDLLVGYRGRLCLIECKSPGGRKTALQTRFMAEWADMPVSLVDGPEAALRALAVLTADMDDGR